MRAGEKDRGAGSCRDTKEQPTRGIGSCRAKRTKLPERGNCQDTQGQSVSILLSDPDLKPEKRSEFREVVFSSQQLTHHELQNLSASGTQKMICSPQTVIRAPGFAKSHYLTEMGREMPANCYKI